MWRQRSRFSLKRKRHTPRSQSGAQALKWVGKMCIHSLLCFLFWTSCSFHCPPLCFAIRYSFTWSCGEAKEARSSDLYIFSPRKQHISSSLSHLFFYAVLYFVLRSLLTLFVSSPVKLSSFFFPQRWPSPLPSLSSSSCCSYIFCVFVESPSPLAAFVAPLDVVPF